jgi:hypothetical protein
LHFLAKNRFFDVVRPHAAQAQGKQIEDFEAKNTISKIFAYKQVPMSSSMIACLKE